jgi:hypothetical protein
VVTPAYATGGPTIAWDQGGVTHSICAYEDWLIDLAGFPTNLTSVNVTYWDTTTQPAVEYGPFAEPVSGGSGSEAFHLNGASYFIGHKFHVDFHLSRTVHGTAKAVIANC